MKRYLLFLLMCFALPSVDAQTQHLSFDHLSIQNGLPEAVVQFVQQDDMGYIWIGTQSGLVRYDGYKTKVYRFGNIIADYQMISMLEDQGKNLWFSTVTNGLFMYNRATEEFKPYLYPKGTLLLSLLFADRFGNLWGYSLNDVGKRIKLMKFDVVKKRFIVFDQQVSINKNGVVVNSDWVGTNAGLLKLKSPNNTFSKVPGITDTSKSVLTLYAPPSEPGILWMNVFDHFSKQLMIERLDTRNKTFKLYNYLTTPGLAPANDSLQTMYQDSRHRLWFGTKRGLLFFQKETGSFINYTPADSSREANKNIIYTITEAKNGLLWCLSGRGLLSFDPATHLFNRITADPNNPDALSANNIQQVMIDRTGILWAGNSSNGVDKINPIKSAFKFYPENIRDGSAFHSGTTNNITTSPAGYTFFCNNTGIYKRNPVNGQFLIVYKARQADAYIDALTVDRDGKLYFCNGKGLQIYSPATQHLESYSTSASDTTSISSNKINVIIQDHTGLIWIGTEDAGVCSLDPAKHKFKRYPYITNNFLLNSGDKLDDQTACCLYEDREGTVWVGTNNGGLNKFNRNTQKFKSNLFDGHRRIGSVTHVYEDSKNRLWVGSYVNGLQEFDRKTGHYTRYLDEQRGLLNNDVSGITEDSKGFLWVNTPAGLSKINPTDLSLKNYPINSILPGKTLIYDYNFISAGKQMILVLTGGVATFNPRDLDDNQYPPAVHIEKISYSNPAATSDSITAKFRYGISQIELPYNQNRITFNYVALHYANPAENKYAYRLDGFDNHWIQAGTQRGVTYTNLSAGTYTFHVKAANSDGVWNNKGDSFTVIIDAPWWLTWWAWILYAVLSGWAIYTFIAYRSRQLVRENKVLEEKIGLRTAQLSNANKELSEQREEITTQRDQLAETVVDLKATQNQLIQAEKMASLGELTAGIAHEIQNPLNFVNNFSEVSIELVDEMETELTTGNKDEAVEIAKSIKGNLEKIRHHGKRADFIVKGMLQHSRSSTGERQLTNINTLADEFLKLSFHGLRAKNKSFNAEMITHFDAGLPKIHAVQQDIGRVLLNLFNNAFYAVAERQKTAEPGYKPTVTVATLAENNHIIIKVKDNGMGIPDKVKEKIMQPFFTTKPTGEGTGLGLSLSYDMVVKGHGGSINVISTYGEGAEFIVTLPIG